MTRVSKFTDINPFRLHYYTFNNYLQTLFYKAWQQLFLYISNSNASYILSYVSAMVDQVYGNKSVATNGTVEALQCRSATDPTLAVSSGSRCLLCTKIFVSPFSGTCAVFTFPLPDT